MDSILNYFNKTLVGDNCDTIALNRIRRIRHSLGYLNNGCIFTNYGSCASRYIASEINLLLDTLQTERILLWTSHLEPEYCKMYKAHHAIFTMSDLSFLSGDHKLVIVLAPQKEDKKKSLFHSVTQYLLNINRQQAKTRTYLYIDNVDELIRTAKLDMEFSEMSADKKEKVIGDTKGGTDNKNAAAGIPMDDLMQLLHHSRRKNIVITGVLNLPMLTETYNYNFIRENFIRNNAAYILVAGGISLYDAEDLSMLCGETSVNIYHTASYSEITLIHAEPHL